MTKMANEQATGHYLEKRIGGGDSRSSYGGSLFLVDAKLKNSHMEHDFLNKDDHLGRERDTRMRYYIRTRNNLQDELNKLKKEKKELSYFEDDPRALRQQVREVTMKVRDGRNHIYERQHSTLYTPSCFEDGRGPGSPERQNTVHRQPARTGAKGKAQRSPSDSPNSIDKVDHTRLNTSGLNLSPRTPIKRNAGQSTGGKGGSKTGQARINYVRRSRSESMSQVEDFLKISKMGSKSSSGSISPPVSKSPPKWYFLFLLL